MMDGCSNFIKGSNLGSSCIDQACSYEPNNFSSGYCVTPRSHSEPEYSNTRIVYSDPCCRCKSKKRTCLHADCGARKRLSNHPEFSYCSSAPSSPQPIRSDLAKVQLFQNCNSPRNVISTTSEILKANKNPFHEQRATNGNQILNGLNTKVEVNDDDKIKADLNIRRPLSFEQCRFNHHEILGRERECSVQNEGTVKMEEDRQRSVDCSLSICAESMELDATEDPTDMVIVSSPSNASDDQDYVMADAAGTCSDSTVRAAAVDSTDSCANHSNSEGSWYLVPCSRSTGLIHAMWII